MNMKIGLLLLLLVGLLFYCRPGEALVAPSSSGTWGKSLSLFFSPFLLMLLTTILHRVLPRAKWHNGDRHFSHATGTVLVQYGTMSLSFFFRLCCSHRNTHTHTECGWQGMTAVLFVCFRLMAYLILRLLYLFPPPNLCSVSDWRSVVVHRFVPVRGISK